MNQLKTVSQKERERLAKWLREGIYDPRNEDDYDSWDVGMEPLPGDVTWAQKKAPKGLD